MAQSDVAASGWAGKPRGLSQRTAFRAFLLALGFVGLKVVSAWLVFPPQQNALLWLPAGLSLAVLLRAERRRWPAYLAAIFVAELLAVWAYGDPPKVGVFWALGNCLRTWAGASLMRRWTGRWTQFTRVRQVAAFVVAGGLISPLPSATFGAAAVALFYGTSHFWADWLIWFLSDSLGALLITPLLLAWQRHGMMAVGRREAVDLTLTLAALLALALFIFSRVAPTGLLTRLPYATLPLVLWAALRLGPRGASAASVALGSVAVWYSTLGLGPFGTQLGEIHERVLAVQMFTAITGLSALTLGALVCERRRAEDTQRLLAEAGAVLAETLDWRLTLPRLAGLIIPEVASGFAVWLTDEEGHTERAVQAGLSTRQEAYFREALTRLGQRTHFECPEEQSSSVLVRLEHGERVLGGLVLTRGERELPLDARDVILAEDIARRCSLAVENARLFQESKEAVHARDEFISIVGHELRTPLTALKLQHQSLGRLFQRTEQPEAQEKLGRAVKQTSRLSWLVESLLDVGRIHTRRMQLEREEVDLGGLAHEVTERLSGELEHAGCAVAVNTEPHVTGWWDRARLQQALTSLLNNALKFGAGHPIDVAVFQRGERACLVVTDRGIGVAPEALERIFGRFERAVSSREYGGLGLGLYLTRRIAEAHGGTIRVASAPGAGASFILELPASPHAEAAAREPLPTHHA